MPTITEQPYETAIFPGLRALSARRAPELLGPGSCSSSNCRGSIEPLNSPKVLQSEYITSSRHDRRARAYLTRQSADSKKIASKLGIGEPTKEPLYLSCRSIYSSSHAPKTARFRIEDGGSCKACHGAAGDYLKSHTVTGASHSENVAKGLTDLSNLNTRATVCLSCHCGTDQKSVNHALYGAGHPRLTFELDAFGVLEPKHWVVVADYERRNGPYIPARAWLLRQLYHAEAALAALECPTLSLPEELPELSLFDCYSCHHSLSEDQWKKRSYGGKPGRLKLNLPALITLSVTVNALDPSVGKQLQEGVDSVHERYRNDTGDDAIDSLQDILTTKVGPILERLTLDTSTETRILTGLANYAGNTPWPTFEVAEQLAVGMQASVASSLELAKRYDISLKELFTTLKSAESFKPEAFTRQATTFLRLLYPLSPATHYEP